MDLVKRLCLMTDDDAVRLAKRVAAGRMDTENLVTTFPPELRDAIRQAFNVRSKSVEKSAAVVAARQALLLLAEDHSDELEQYLKAGEGESLAFIAAATAALVILQTEVKIKKDKAGNWTLEFHKRSASDGLLKSFVKSILGLG